MGMPQDRRGVQDYRDRIPSDTGQGESADPDWRAWSGRSGRSGMGDEARARGLTPPKRVYRRLLRAICRRLYLMVARSLVRTGLHGTETLRLTEQLQSSIVTYA